MKTWKFLGYLGLIPFIFFLCLTALPSELFFINPKQSFVYYSAIILSFLAGTLWQKDNGISAQSTLPNQKTLATSKLQIYSNVFCLIAFSALFLPEYFALMLLPMGYLIFLGAEYIFNKKEYETMTLDYFSTRLILTICVTLLHGIALIIWF